MIRQGERTVNGIKVEELFDFLRDLGGGVKRRIVVRLPLAVDAPVVYQALEHAEWAELVELAQPAEDGELLVCHTHV